MTRYGILIRFATVALLAFLASGATPQAARSGTHQPRESMSPALRYAEAQYDELPILFEPNVGQAPRQFAYVASGTGYRLALSEQGLTVALPPHAAESSIHHRRSPSLAGQPSILRIRLIGATRHPVLRPERRKASFTNYFIGKDPARWRTHVPNYAAIRYQDVYPGIDWVVYGNRRHLLEYDLIVHPHADPARIVLAVTGPRHVFLDRTGAIRIDVHGRILRQLQPVIYQVSATGTRERIEGHYELAHGHVRIAVGHYDHARTLFIDPTLVYSTYFGGTGGSDGYAIAVDSEGDIYVAGTAGTSAGFPTVDPYQAVDYGNDAFVAKFDPSGTKLLYSTFLGGSNAVLLVKGIAVDSTGSAYVAGTTSPGFPIVNAYQTQFKGTGAGADQGFVTKFSPDGSSLEYSTYLGGSGNINQINALAIDSAGDAYVAGVTDSTDFPTTAQAFQSSLRGRGNAFVTELNPAGNGLVYSTYLGGSAFDAANAIAVDTTGDAYVAGSTNSTDFPLVHPFQSTNYASANGSTATTAFVAKLNAEGTALEYSSYLGGSGDDGATGIAVDSAGNAYVTGATESTDFPTVNAYQSTNRDAEGLGGSSAFVSKVNSAGTALVYSTYLGGSGGGNGILGDAAEAIVVDSGGDAYVTGHTASTDFPTVNAVQETNNGAAIGATNAFVSELDPSGNELLFSTYLGGSGSFNYSTIPGGDYAWAIALGSAGDIYITGITESSNFPTANAFQSTNKTVSGSSVGDQAFVARFGVNPGPAQSTTSRGGGGGMGWYVLGLLAVALGFRWWRRRFE